MRRREQPGSPSLPPVDRRALLRGSALIAGLAAAPLSAAIGARGFTHGVASGEPGARRIMLWTRYVADSETTLACELSETLDFSRIVAGGSVTASPERDHCAKLFVEGLEPGHWYYYRFTAPDGSRSDIGRTKTLPEGPTASFRMAVFSCSNIGFGWFNAYAHAAQDDAFDCALHLGDYLYEYRRGTYPEEPLAGRQPEPANEIVALADYRARYAQYRSDPDLRRLHQLYPMISICDDHETANDAWSGGAENHDPASEGEWSARKGAAMRANREWLPVSDDPWASYDIGDLATLFRLETRLTARARPFDLWQVFASGGGSREGAEAALRAFRDGDLRDPKRELLGAAQQAWLGAGLAASRKAGRVWQVLVQQVIMGRLYSAPQLAGALAADTPEYVRRRVLAGATAGAEGVPYNMDAWDGYPAARDRLYAAALEADANLVTLTGDTHNAWAFDLDQGGTPVGVEFAGASVTSPGLENSLKQVPTKSLEQMVVAANPPLKWMDGSQRGYMAVELTPGAAICEHRFVSPVRERGATLVGAKRMATMAGNRRKIDLT